MWKQIFFLNIFEIFQKNLETKRKFGKFEEILENENLEKMF